MVQKLKPDVVRTAFRYIYNTLKANIGQHARGLPELNQLIDDENNWQGNDPVNLPVADETQIIDPNKPIERASEVDSPQVKPIINQTKEQAVQRVRDAMFNSMSYATPEYADELLHQLDLWRDRVIGYIEIHAALAKEQNANSPGESSSSPH
jgi:hypothetical protein